MPLPHLRFAALSRAAGALLLMLGMAAHAGSAFRIVAYDTAEQPLSTVAADRIDVINFAFARVVDGEPALTADARQRLATRVALKAAHPRLKVVVSVGGWGAGGFSEAAATPAGRARFAQGAARLVTDNHADGFDVDWEYPGHAEAGIAASPDDRGNFTALIAATRAALDQAGARTGRHYLLTIAAADGPFVDGIDIARVAPLLDWFNLMTYDFCNAMTPTTCHHTGLHASKFAPADARTLARAVRQFLAAGVPAAKLMPGVAFYGREFAAVDPAHDGVFQAYGTFVGTPGWRELKARYIGHDGYVRHWDAQADAPFLWNPRTRHFVSYDDPQSIAAKAAYVKARHLGGLMYWQQGSDDHGELLQAVWQGLRPPRRNGAPGAI